MQAHYGLDHPPLEDLEKSIVAFAEAGADVHITELDITVLPSPLIIGEPRYPTILNTAKNGSLYRMV